MKPNTPTLIWARQNFLGEIYEDSANETKPMAEQWPDTEDEELRQRLGEVKLFRVVFEPVSQEEQDEHEAAQKAFFAARRKSREQPAS